MFAVLMLAAATVASDSLPVRPASNTRAHTHAPAIVNGKRMLADSILVDKSDRKLTLYYRGEEVKTYDIALGRNPVGDKARRGDGKTPEGLYFIEGRNP